MWNENRLTELLNIKYPIIQAGMAGGVTTPELVAAVSNSGALGTIGAGYLSPDKTRAIITQVKALTDKPFAVNLFVPEPLNVDKTQIDKSKAALHPMYKELGIDNLPEIDVENLNTLYQSHLVQIEIVGHYFPPQGLCQLQELHIHFGYLLERLIAIGVIDFDTVFLLDPI